MKALVLLLVFTISLYAKNYEVAGEKFKVTQLFQGKNIIWGMVELPDNSILFTEKSGVIRHLDPSSGLAKELKHEIPSTKFGQGGLLDIQLSPTFNSTNEIYVTYARKSSNGRTTGLGKFKFKNGQISSFSEVFVANTDSNTGRHFGSRIAFDEKNHLYFTVGDRGKRELVQDFSNHHGVVIRLNLDGSIPEDNPFTKDPKVLSEIWSLGHRNPQGLFYDKEARKLWLQEHGPRGGDEINLIEKGKNYGWPIITYGKEYFGPFSIGEGTHKKGLEQPVYQYTPSIAPSGLLVYSGKLFSSWKGFIMSGALKFEHINALKEEKGEYQEIKYLEDLEERIRHLIEIKSGEILFSTDSGKIFKIEKI